MTPTRRPTASPWPLLIGVMVVVAALSVAVTLWLLGETPPRSVAVEPTPVAPVLTAPVPQPPRTKPAEEAPEPQQATPLEVLDLLQETDHRSTLDLDTEIERLGIVDIDPAALAVVEGRVVDGLDQPLPLSAVSLVDQRGEYQDVAFANDDGRFRFESDVPLLAGWSLSTGIDASTMTEDDPRATAPAAYTHADDLRPGEEAVQVTLVVAPAPRLEGLVVLGATRAPAEFAIVEVLSRSSGWRETSQIGFTEVDGSFSMALTQLPPSDLLIRASDGTGLQIVVGPLTLAPGEVHWLELALQEPLSLSGRVVDKFTGEPLPGAQVTSLPTHPLIDVVPLQTVCDDEGRFTLTSLTPSAGRLRLHVVAEDHAAALILVADPSAALEVRLGAPVVLSGTVHDALSELTVRFASVICTLPSMEGAGPAWSDMTLCDEQGAFVLPLRTVPAAAALLLVESPGHVLSRRPLADLIPVQLGKRTYKLRIDLARTHAR